MEWHIAQRVEIARNLMWIHFLSADITCVSTEHALRLIFPMEVNVFPTESVLLLDNVSTDTASRLLTTATTEIRPRVTCVRNLAQELEFPRARILLYASMTITTTARREKKNA
jgi:hypothetical protein